MKRVLPYLLALLLDVVGAGGALLVSTRRWQTVTVARPAPLHDDVLGLSGRTVDAAPTALALVALAGVVAVLATRGRARRLVGAVLALAGTGLVWRAVTAAAAVSTQRARVLVADHHANVNVGASIPHVQTSAAWPLLTGICGALVLGSGAVIAWRGHRWQVMSARYEAASPAPATDPAKAAATLWTALDRGEDPTN